MSACLVMQQYDKIFIGSDTAVSGVVDNKIRRIHNNGEKIFRKDNYIIFCSGNMNIANKLINYIKNMDKINIEDIQNYIKDIHKYDSMFEIFISDCDKIPIETYNLSSYRNFDILKTKCKQGETQLYTLGFKTNEIMNSVSRYIKLFNGNVTRIYESSFNDNCCEEIGGNLELYYYVNNHINNKSIKLKDNCTPMINNFVNENVCNYLTAEYLVGKVLLGENLVIESEDSGCFFVGDGEKVGENNEDFGLYIFSKTGTEKTKRVFLGLHDLGNGTQQARLELYDKTGRKLVLSEDGILQTNSSSGYGYVNSSYPFYGYFYVDEGTNYIDACKVRFRCGKLRSTTKGTGAGGNTTVKTTEDGGGGTSQDGGGGTSYDGGAYSTTKTYTSLTYTQEGINTTPTSNPSDPSLSLINHYHTYTIPVHSHDVKIEIDIPAHNHTIPAHNHYINPHSHKISFDWNHTHEQIYGLWEGNTVASNVSLYVNGTLVKSGMNGNVNELDIKNYIKIGQWNELKFTSSTDGSIAYDLFMKSFNLF